MIQRKKFKIIAGLIVSVALIWHMRLPDYREYGSRVMTCSNYKETTIYVLVYKAHYNRYLYDLIAEQHNRINGQPDKLTMKLYFTELGLKSGRKAYRTVVYDYEHGTEYILLE